MIWTQGPALAPLSSSVEGCDVQNIVTTVIIRVGSDALWGHLARGVFTPQTRFEKKKKSL